MFQLSGFYVKKERESSGTTSELSKLDFTYK